MRRKHRLDKQNRRTFAGSCTHGVENLQRFVIGPVVNDVLQHIQAENAGGRRRYRLLETVRQYALEKLGESGEADVVRARHRDHYMAMAAQLDQPNTTDHQQRVDRADIEIDNLRAHRWQSRQSPQETLRPRVRRAKSPPSD